MGPFEPFRASSSKPSRSNAAGLRVRADGRLVLNAAALRELAGATHVRLLWDADTDRFGIQPTNPSDSFGFLVSRSPSQGTISSREFVEAHSLRPGARYALEREGDIWAATERAEL